MGGRYLVLRVDDYDGPAFESPKGNFTSVKAATEAMRKWAKRNSEHLICWDKTDWAEIIVRYKPPHDIPNNDRREVKFHDGWRQPLGIMSWGGGPMQARIIKDDRTQEQIRESWCKSFPGKAWWDMYTLPFPGYEHLK